MQRARERDQFVRTGTSGIAHEVGLCMEVPLAMRIARGSKTGEVGHRHPQIRESSVCNQDDGFFSNALVGTNAVGFSPSSATAPPSMIFNAASLAANAIQQTAPFFNKVHAISTV